MSLGQQQFQPTRSTGARRAWTLATLCLAVLIAQLDTSVVNLAVRPIGDYFHAGTGSLQWVVDGYNLVYAVFLLTAGLLADLYGRRRLFMAGAGVFCFASVLCALAPSIPALIAGRLFAGFGAAGQILGGLALAGLALATIESQHFSGLAGAAIAIAAVVFLVFL